MLDLAVRISIKDQQTPWARTLAKHEACYGGLSRFFLRTWLRIYIESSKVAKATTMKELCCLQIGSTLRLRTPVA